MRFLFLPVALLLASCRGSQSVIDSAGASSAEIERLWWLFFWLLLTIFVLVMAVLVGAIGRRHRGIEQEPLQRTHRPSEETEGRMGRFVGYATGATVLILLALIVLSVRAGKLAAHPTGNPLTIEVMANQWWWFVRYVSDEPGGTLVTANEMHVPTGRPVMIRGTSNDVIHSFWAPNLQGKRDLIPSRTSILWFRADRPGRYRGQCAEFCGAQHAHMAFWIIAEPQAEYQRWLNAQLQAPPPPSTPDRIRGQQVFLNRACILCHNIGGTTAAGQVGPDLTHFGSRMTIAAGTLPNNRGNLAGWITDPQTVKPGTHMATVPLPAADVQSVVDYLESLQ